MYNKDELLAKWDYVLKATEDIFSWDAPEDLAYLAEEASKAKRIIECGVYMGKGSKTMLLANPECEVFSVDPFMVDGTRQVAEYWLRPEIIAGRCHIVPMFTLDAGVALANIKGTVDMVFVDDGHAFRDVVTDITTWYPYLRSGGLICGHDFEGPWVDTPMNDVTRAVNELLPDAKWVGFGRCWEYRKP